MLGAVLSAVPRRWWGFLFLHRPRRHWHLKVGYTNTRFVCFLSSSPSTRRWLYSRMVASIVRHWRDEFVCARDRKQNKKFNFFNTRWSARVRRETDIIASRGWSPHEISVFFTPNGHIFFSLLKIIIIKNEQTDKTYWNILTAWKRILLFLWVCWKDGRIVYNLSAHLTYTFTTIFFF